MKAVLYARVSSKEQQDEGYSLPAQEKLLKEYSEKKDLKIVKVFSIQESAGGKTQRKVFAEMLAYVTKQDIKVIICEKVDRLTRNFRDAVDIDTWLDTDEQRQVHLVKNNLVLHKNSRSQEKLNWGVQLLFAKNYIDNLSEEVKKGMGEKIRQGWFPGRPPLGYKTVGEKGKRIHVIDETIAPLVTEMFELYASGEQSTMTLQDLMYAKGFRTGNGKKVYKSRISVLLADPFYIGKMRFNGVVYPALHQPLVTEEVFNRVQSILHGKTQPRYRKHLPLFKSFVHCANCGGLYTWETHKGHWYGHCNRYKGCKERKFVRQELIEEQLLQSFKPIAIKSERLIEWIKKALKESHEQEISYGATTRERLRLQYEQMQRRLEALYDDKLDGKITEEFYNAKFKQYSEQRDSLHSQLKSFGDANKDYYELGCNILELASKASQIYSNPKRTVEERRALLRLIFSNLVVNQDKLKVYYTKAFEILSDFVPEWNEAIKKFEPQKSAVNKSKSTSNVEMRFDWLGSWDSNPGPIG